MIGLSAVGISWLVAYEAGESILCMRGGYMQLFTNYFGGTGVMGRAA